MEILTKQLDREFTVEEFLQIEEELCQLINGKAIMTPAPNTNHQLAVGEIYTILKPHVCKGFLLLAPLDVFLDDKNVFQPDLLYVSEKRNEIISERGIEGAPDLIVEVLSPSNAFFDRYSKKDTYFKCGVREYWIVDPNNKTLEIYTLSQSDKNIPHLHLVAKGEVTSTVMPSLKFDLVDVFKILK